MKLVSELLADCKVNSVPLAGGVCQCCNSQSHIKDGYSKIAESDLILELTFLVHTD